MTFKLDDDLCQLVLSYLNFEDKVRLECVSRQWQRLIYNGVTQLEYPFYDPDNHYFWSRLPLEKRSHISQQILNKCRNVSRLRVYPVCDTALLHMIVDRCSQLNSIELRFDSNHIDSNAMKVFSQICGQNLRNFTINKSSEDNFNSETGLDLLIQFNEFFTKLTQIYAPIDSLKGNEKFKHFTDNFSQSITYLALRLKFSDSFRNSNECFDHISRFTNLKTLNLVIESDKQIYLDLPFVAQLLSKNCSKVSQLSLKFRGEVTLPESNIPLVLANFKYLKRFNLKVMSKVINSSKLITFGSNRGVVLKGLDELKVHIQNISDNHLADIAISCPNLKSIEVKTMQDISDNSLNSLSKLKSLEKMFIFSKPHKVYDISDSGVCRLIKSCPNIKSIALKLGVNVTNTTIKVLKDLADSQPNRVIRFSFCWKRTAQQNQLLPEGQRFNHTRADYFLSELNQLPKNLKIFTREYFTGWCGTSTMSEICGYEQQFVGNRSDDDQFGQWPPKMSVAQFHTYMH